LKAVSAALGSAWEGIGALVEGPCEVAWLEGMLGIAINAALRIRTMIAQQRINKLHVG